MRTTNMITNDPYIPAITAKKIPRDIPSISAAPSAPAASDKDIGVILAPKAAQIKKTRMPEIVTFMNSSTTRAIIK